MKEEINVFQDANSLSEGFTAFLQKLLSVYPHVNIALSGGTTPKAVFDYWAANCKDSIAWDRISFFWSDERCVPADNAMNNYGMARDHLFSKIPAINPKSIYRIHGENEPEEEAVWYSEVLKRKTLQRNGNPCFELMILGMGDDGHTASVFPNQIELWDHKEACTVGEHPTSGMKRITLTGTVINNAQHIVFLAMGKQKAEMVRDIIRNKKKFSTKLPAARVNPDMGYLYWFLDSEAASLL